MRLLRRRSCSESRTFHCPLDGIENEELGFGTEVGGIAQAGRLQVCIATLGDGTRIAVIALAVGRFDDVAGDCQCRLFQERIDERRSRIGQQHHIRSLNALPSGDRGTVEIVTGFELFRAEGFGRHAHVLFLAARVGETEIDEFNVLFLDQLENFFCRHGFFPRSENCANLAN